MDFLPGASQPEDHADPEPVRAPFQPNIVIMPNRSTGVWTGVWAIDDENGHEEFMGPRDEVIGWARSRCERIFIWSDQLRDVTLLGASSDI